MREVSRAIALRAMLRIGNNDTDGAWNDLMVCHRLARLAGQCPRTAVEALVAFTIENMASSGDQVLLHHAKLSSARIAAMQDDLACLPTLPAIAETIEMGERYLCLDSVIDMSRQMKDPKRQKPGDRAAPAFLADRTMDWESILRMVNTQFDHFVAAARKPSRDERKNAMDAIESGSRKYN